MTVAACSPPMTLIRAFGHMKWNRGEYARPHMPVGAGAERPADEDRQLSAPVRKRPR
jgi:hypothetical protein